MTSVVPGAVAVAVALAGAIGAVTRVVLDGALRTRLGGGFPWATIVVNVSGSLMLGVLAGLVANRGADPHLLTLAGVGFCGGYTTFSTASVETLILMRRGRLGAAVGNAVGSLVVTVVAAWLGLTLTRL